MNNFAFIIHPIDPQKDVSRKYPVLGKLPVGIIDTFCRYFPPVYLSHVTGIRSEATGAEIEGWLLACPLTPKRMLEVPVKVAYGKIIQTGRLAERMGAQLLGLGAFTSVVGDAGITVAKHLSIPATTGNSYTVSVAVEAALEAARQIGIEPREATGAVVGAYGSMGRACAHLLARHLPRMILVGRQAERLQAVRQEILASGCVVETSTAVAAIRQADLILTVTSAVAPIVEPEHLRPGVVVCDVARPRNVSNRVAQQRHDVLIIEGGIIRPPGDCDFGFDFGFPPGTAYACMAETMILALEGRNECFTLGREISLERVEEIARLATSHGFRSAGFRAFERAVTDEEIARVRQARQAANRSIGEPAFQPAHLPFAEVR